MVNISKLNSQRLLDFSLWSVQTILIPNPPGGVPRCFENKQFHHNYFSGLVLIPLVGSRGCLIVGSFLLVLANLLTYWRTTSLKSILMFLASLFTPLELFAFELLLLNKIIWKHDLELVWNKVDQSQIRMLPIKDWNIQTRPTEFTALTKDNRD